jgi:hypothetical protein
MWRVGRLKLFSNQRKINVPINCRTPSPESTRVTGKEKLEWAGYVVALTLIFGGIQLAQFYVTSAVNVNKNVGEELSRRRCMKTEEDHHIHHDSSSTV